MKDCVKSRKHNSLCRHGYEAQDILTDRRFNACALKECKFEAGLVTCLFTIKVMLKKEGLDFKWKFNDETGLDFEVTPITTTGGRKL